MPHILKMIEICEIFKSIQGESTYSGKICVFIRLSRCNLSCIYCDTTYAFKKGTPYTIDQILDTLKHYSCSLVEITGGEPLLQEETPHLCQVLIDHSYQVLVETNGTYDISILPQECIKIMDIKCPDSGCDSFFYFDNVRHLTPLDECKMVISSKKDFIWALDFLYTHSLQNKCTVLFSPNTNRLEPKILTQWILEENAPVRLNLQLHTIIWGSKERGR